MPTQLELLHAAQKTSVADAKTITLNDVVDDTGCSIATRIDLNWTTLASLLADSSPSANSERGNSCLPMLKYYNQVIADHIADLTNTNLVLEGFVASDWNTTNKDVHSISLEVELCTNMSPLKITIGNIIMESKRAEARSVQLALDRRNLDLYKQRLNAHENPSLSFANEMKESGVDGDYMFLCSLILNTNILALPDCLSSWMDERCTIEVSGDLNMPNMPNMSIRDVINERGNTLILNVAASTSSMLPTQDYSDEFRESVRANLGTPKSIWEPLNEAQQNEYCDAYEVHRMKMEMYRVLLKNWMTFFTEANKRYTTQTHQRKTFYDLIVMVYGADVAAKVHQAFPILMNYVTFPEVFFVTRWMGFGIHFEEATEAFVAFMTCAGTVLVQTTIHKGSSLDADTTMFMEEKKRLVQLQRKNSTIESLGPISIHSSQRLHELQRSMVLEELLQCAIKLIRRVPSTGEPIYGCRGYLFKAYDKMSPITNKNKSDVGRNYHSFVKGVKIPSETTIHHNYFLHESPDTSEPTNQVRTQLQACRRLEVIRKRTVVVGVIFQSLSPLQFQQMTTTTSRHGPTENKFVFPDD